MNDCTHTFTSTYISLSKGNLTSKIPARRCITCNRLDVTIANATRIGTLMGEGYRYTRDNYWVPTVAPQLVPA